MSAAGGGATPSKIGRYEIVRYLGRGAMGKVFLARDPHLEDLRAIKILSREYESPEFLDKFKREAKSAARLNHKNIVRFFEFGMDPPHIVMEYCDGGDLKDVIKSRRRITGAQILEWVEQICAGLIEAHSEKIYHRDLKPSNIMFGSGMVKIGDFGLAKFVGGGRTLTTAHAMMGTPPYVSPEQWKDAKLVSNQTDIWAVGVILYEMLTWARPFDKPGDTLQNILANVLLQPPRPYPCPVPEPFAGLIGRALEKELGNRISDAEEFIQQIREIRSANAALLEQTYPAVGELDERSRRITAAVELFQDGQVSQAAERFRELKTEGIEDSVIDFWEKRIDQAGQPPEDATPSTGEQPTSLIVEKLRSEASNLSKSMAEWSSLIPSSVRDEIASVLKRVGSLSGSVEHQVAEKYSDLLKNLRETLRLEGGKELGHRLEEARNLLDRGESSAARQLLNRILGIDPDNTIAHELMLRVEEAQIRSRRLEEILGRAAQREQARKWDEAIALFREAGQIDPDNSRVRDGIARMEVLIRRRQERDTVKGQADEALRAGRFDDARGLWDRFLEEFPHDELGETERARVQEARAEREVLDLARSRLETARGFKKEGQEAKALRILEKIHHPDLRQDVAVLREEIRLRLLDRRRAEWKRLMDAARRGLEGGRYAALGRRQDELLDSLSRLESGGGSEDPEQIQAGLRDLRKWTAAAERDLLDCFNRAHAGLLHTLERGLDAAVSPDPEAEGAEALAAARSEAVRVLAAADPGQTGTEGDPIGDLERVREALDKQLEAVSGPGPAGAGGGAESAETLVSEMEAVLASVPAGAAPDQGGALVEEAGRLLPDLKRAVSEGLPVPADTCERIGEIRDRLRALRFSTSLDSRMSLDRALQEADWRLRGASGEPQSKALSAAIETGRKALASGDPARFREAEVGLRRIIGGAAGGPDRWPDVEKEFETRLRALRAGAGGDGAGDPAGRIDRLGERFRALRQAEDLDGAGELLQGLSGIETEIRLREAGGRLQPLIDRLESMADGDSGGPGPGGVLNRARQALAAGDVGALAGVEAEIRKVLGRAGASGSKPAKAPIPAAQRRYNERHHPLALQRIDRAWTRREAARGTARAGDREREFRAARAGLLRPPSIRRRAAIAVVVAAAAGGLSLAGWFWNGSDHGPAPLTVLSWKRTGARPEMTCGNRAVELSPLEGVDGGWVVLRPAGAGCRLVAGSVEKSIGPGQSIVWIDEPDSSQFLPRLFDTLSLQGTPTSATGSE